jgi:integrase
MKKLYRMFRRGRRYYVEHIESRQQTSLGTSDHAEALRLWTAKNEAAQSPRLNLALARAYLSGHDQRMSERAWSDVMAEIVLRAKPKSKERYERAVQERAFDTLRSRKLIETTSEDFLNALRNGTKSTNHFLRRVHNLALGLAWLPTQILAPKLWPPVRPALRRGITLVEHRLILVSEKNEERRRYYELLWETGGSQTDVVNLRAENILWDQGILCYSRCKLSPTAPPAQLAIGRRLAELLRELPSRGPLFPNLSKLPAQFRAAEFCRRCRVAGVKGVSLHSYRYAWAERAQAAGYPERYAQTALGHGSRAVHRFYAKQARVVCPSLEDYENKLVEFPIPAPTATQQTGHTSTRIDGSRDESATQSVRNSAQS